jgi:flagellar export protein FliJ
MKPFPLTKVQAIRQLELDQAKQELMMIRQSIHDVLLAIEHLEIKQGTLLEDRNRKLSEGISTFDLNQDQIKINALTELKKTHETKLTELRMLEDRRLKVVLEKKQTVNGLDKLKAKFLSNQALEQRKQEADFVESTLVHKQR